MLHPRTLRADVNPHKPCYLRYIKSLDKVKLMPKWVEAVVEAVIATFGVPLVFMIGDYIMRLKTKLASKSELLHQVGGDCCILSLGATGGVYIDPHVQSVPTISSGLAPTLMIGFLIIMRYACITIPGRTKHSPKLSIFLGLTSMFLVSGVLVVGFIFGKP